MFEQDACHRVVLTGHLTFSPVWLDFPHDVGWVSPAGLVSPIVELAFRRRRFSPLLVPPLVCFRR
jgi:hypothetical protein